MKRVLIFSLAYYPHVGGAEVAIKEITHRITDVEFHMLTMQFGGAPAEERIGNVIVHRIGKSASYLSKILFVPRAAFKARALHRAQSFDGFWAMMSYMVLPIVLVRRLGVRVPYALTLQDGDPYEHVFKRWFILPFLPLLYSGFRNANVVTVLSTYLAAWGKRMGYRGVPVVIPNGADTQHFSQEFPPSALDEVKDSLGKKMGDVFLVTSSRLVHKNAIDDVIRALPMLPSNVRFIVLGEGPDKSKLKSLAHRLELEDRVRFVGHVGHDELPKYLKACDIFVRPSRTEGFGASFPEAMAAGLPVVATQEGGIADFLFDVTRNPEKAPTGWAVNKDAPKQIAEAVKAIMNDPHQMGMVVGNAKKMVEEKYDWNLIASRMRTEAFDPLFV